MNSQLLIRVAAVTVATAGLATVAAFSGLPATFMGQATPPFDARMAENITLIAKAPAALPQTQAAPIAAALEGDANAMRAPAVLPVEAQAQPQAPAAPAAADCRTDLAIIAQAGAMVDLGLIAPCRADARVVIRHGDLVVSSKTSPAGTLIASLPAFENPAEFTLSFSDGVEVSDRVEIPDLAQYERFAVQWVAGDSFTLNAFVDGAQWEGEGHVTAARSEPPSGKGGFLLQSGMPTSERPLLAQSYTWPMGRTSADAGIEITLESEVTASTCGREVLAETLHMVEGKTTVQELTLDMPPCEAIGEFLVLSNPFALPTVTQN